MSILDVYRQAGAMTVEQILALAESIGPSALFEARLALNEGAVSKEMHGELDVILDRAELGENVTQDLNELLARAVELYNDGLADGEVGDWHSNAPIGRFDWNDFTDDHMIKSIVPQEERIGLLRVAAQYKLNLLLNPEFDKPMSDPYRPLYRAGTRVMSSEKTADMLDRYVIAIRRYVEQIAQLTNRSRKTESHLVEALSSTVAITFIKALPIGKNLSSWMRKICGQYDKLICMVEMGKIPYANVVGMIKASLPDVATKLETYQLGQTAPTLAVVFSKLAGKSPSMKSGGAADVLADERDAPRLSDELNRGRLPFDTSAIRIIPARMPKDSDERIAAALRMNDRGTLQQLLDPMVFSDEQRIRAFGIVTAEARLVGGKWDSYTGLHDALDVLLDETEHDRLTPARLNEFERSLPEMLWHEIDLRSPENPTIDRPPYVSDYKALDRDELIADFRAWAHYHLDRLILEFVEHSDEWSGQSDINRFWQHRARNQIDSIIQAVDSVDMFMNPTEAIVKEYPKLGRATRKLEKKRPGLVGDDAISEADSYSCLPGNVNSLRGHSSSAWSSGIQVLAKPQQSVPEDENEDEYSILDTEYGNMPGARMR